jgi:L-ascorbate metabolism protein UlaG (beta-lactamase superfamily)
MIKMSWKKWAVTASAASLGLLAASGYSALNWRPSLQPYSALAYQAPPAAERGLKLQFFGTTTVLLSDGRNSVLIDGFLSRPGWLRVVTTPFGPDTERIDAALARATVRRVDAVFVAHSHHDHAMDVGVVARKTNAKVVGSASTLSIARGEDLADDRLIALQVGEPSRFGDFKVTAYETPHSPTPVFLGTITEPLVPPAKLSAYKMGENYSFLVEHPLGRVLIVPSANYTSGMFAGVRADVVLLGIGSLGKQSEAFAEAYWDETVRQSGARLVLPIHWDDFGRGLEEPLVPMPYALDDFETSMARLHGFATRDGVTVRLLRAFDPTFLPMQTIDGQE